VYKNNQFLIIFKIDFKYTTFVDYPSNNSYIRRQIYLEV